MPWNIPDEPERTFPEQSILYEADLDGLVMGIGGDGVVTGCEVAAQGVADGTVAVAAGAVSLGGARATVSAGNVNVLSGAGGQAADATNPRLDLIVVDGAGAKSAVHGTAAAPPIAPELPAGRVLLARVQVPAAATTITATMISSRVTTTARIGVRANSGATTYARRRINHVAGTNMTITVDDDAANEETRVTYNAVAGSSPTSVDVVLVAAFNAPLAVRNAANFLCDGVADEVQINAALALTDSRPVLLSTGTFNTVATIAFVDGVRHDLWGSSEDGTVVVANHAGNALQVHHVYDINNPAQEWRMTIGNFRIAAGATRPARGVSVLNAAFLRFHRLFVSGHTTNLYGDFFNTCQADECQFSDGVNGVHLLGSVSDRESHHNTFRSCQMRANDVGVLIETRAHSNLWDHCIFEPFLSTDVGFRIPAGATKVEGQRIDTAWFEGDGVGFDLQDGDNIQIVQPRIGVLGEFVKSSTFAAKGVTISDPVYSVAAGIQTLPDGIHLGIDQSDFNGNQWWALYGSRPGSSGDSAYATTVTAKSLLPVSFGALAGGSGARLKNLVTQDDAASWSGASGAVTGGQADPFGGTGAASYASAAFRTHTMTAANGGAALEGATFAITVAMKGNGTRALLKFSDGAVAGADGIKRILLKNNEWTLATFIYKFATPGSPSTGTNLTATIQADSGACVFWIPTIVRGTAAPPLLREGFDASAITGPFSVFGTNLNVETHGTTAPTTGTWAVGDRRVNTNPATGVEYWLCTIAGAPGTWVAVSVGQPPAFWLDAFGAKGDGVTNDGPAIDAWLNAWRAAGGGDLHFGNNKTYVSDRRGTGIVAFPGLGWIARISHTDPPCHIYGHGSTLKLAAAQIDKSHMFVIGGEAVTTQRTSPMTVEDLVIDQNWAAQTVVSSGNIGMFSDQGAVTVLFADDTTFRNCTFKNYCLMGIQVFRNSRGTRLMECTFDGTHGLATGWGAGGRIECMDIEVHACRFVCHYSNGRGHLQIGDNADFRLAGRGMRITESCFAGGYGGFAVALGGVTHCYIAGNFFRDVGHLSGYALQIEKYSNPNGTIWDGAWNVIQGNAFMNVRGGIILSGANGILAGANYTMGAYGNLIADNMITRDMSEIRTVIGSAELYPDRFSPAPGAPGNEVVGVTMNVGIHVQGNTIKSGIAAASAPTTLVDNAGGMTVNAYQNLILVMKTGVLKGQSRRITSNSATTHTLNAAWDPFGAVTAPQAGDTYDVTQLVGWNTIRHNTIWTTGATGIGIRDLSVLPQFYDNNKVFGTTGALAFQFGANPNARYDNNLGFAGDPSIGYAHVVYADRGRGTATIPSGSTAVTVTHKLGRTPLVEQIMVMPTNSPDFDPGNFWVSGLTGTTFVINVRANPGASGATFAWQAMGSP